LRILILGSDNLAAPLKKLGHNVLFCGHDPGADLAIDRLDPDWRDIRPGLQKRGFSPDVVLVTDNLGLRTLPTGLWAVPAVTVFYGIDSPINRFWHSAYAPLFDLVFMDQPKEAEQLAKLGDQAHWLPVGVDYSLYENNAGAARQKGVCFVGVVDEKVRPKRSALLDKVAGLTRVSHFGGRQGEWLDTQKAAELYRGFDLVINENLFPGVTTRPLEGMASAGCVFSEAAPGCMDRLFTNYKDISYFTPDSLVQRLKELLGDAALRARLSEQGRETVRTGHTLLHRARVMMDEVKKAASQAESHSGRARGGPALLMEGRSLLMAGLRWPEKEPRRLQRALGRLRVGLKESRDDLDALRAAGLAEASCGNMEESTGYLRAAAEMGGDSDRFRLGLAAWADMRHELARDIFKNLSHGFSGLDHKPGEADFHLAAAELLRGHGESLSVGFDRRRRHPCAWLALEHLQFAVGADPGLEPAWELMGDVLLNSGAPNQAWDCYQRALSLRKDDALAAKSDQAAREGYLV
jgi:hypothetical protein